MPLWKTTEKFKYNFGEIFFVVLTHLKTLLLYLSHSSLMGAKLNAKRYLRLRVSKKRDAVVGWHVGEQQASPAVGNAIKLAYFFITPLRILKWATLTICCGYRKRKAVKALKGHQRHTLLSAVWTPSGNIPTSHWEYLVCGFPQLAHEGLQFFMYLSHIPLHHMQWYSMHID